ncbi:MAG: DUF1810 domain-containing protein [Campylobacterota bacterium]
MSDTKQYELDRFVEAQKSDFDIALHEIIKGQKRSHWIWYIFPQVAGLGHSLMAKKYAIGSKAEAAAYLEHEVLGPRLRQCAAALLEHTDKSITAIMGHPDDMKLKSSMTLFAAISPPDNVFSKVLNAFYSGDVDQVTTEFVENNP